MLRVTEIFGPVIQGEGPNVGCKAMFVRFHGCDYRCSFCDTPQSLVGAVTGGLSVEMSVPQIVELLSPGRVVLTGGNPCLQDLKPLIAELRKVGSASIEVETQGSVWPDWLYDCDVVTISPKSPRYAPSVVKFDWDRVYRFFQRFSGRATIKCVVFDCRDAEWAYETCYAPLVSWFEMNARYEFCLQVGTKVGEDDVSRLLGRWEVMLEAVLRDPRWGWVRVLPQAHRLVNVDAEAKNLIEVGLSPDALGGVCQRESPYFSKGGVRCE